MDVLNKTLSQNGITLNYTLRRLGNNFLLVVAGGEEHIGCSVLAIPRPSLKNPDKTSSTISILNVLSHKDDELAIPLAEELSIITNQPAVVIAGVHFDCLDYNALITIKEINRMALSNLKDWIEEFKF